MKKLLSLFVFSCAIIANEEIPMFPSTSDDVLSYLKILKKSFNVGDSLIEFSYFRPSTWFSKGPLSPKQIQGVHDSAVLSIGVKAVMAYSLHSNPFVYNLLVNEWREDGEKLVQLLYKSTSPGTSVSDNQTSVCSIEANIDKSIAHGLTLAENKVSSLTFKECASLRDAFIFKIPEVIVANNPDNKLAFKVYEEKMNAIFSLLQKCSKYSK